MKTAAVALIATVATGASAETQWVGRFDGGDPAIPAPWKVKRKERQAMIADLLDRFNIVAKKELFPQQLSGGQQQLVGIARAIVGKPKLLLADEPTGNLHSKQGEMIMETLRELHAEGMTIIQVTHNDKFAAYGQRIIHLEDGMIKTV